MESREFFKLRTRDRLIELSGKIANQNRPETTREILAYKYLMDLLELNQTYYKKITGVRLELSVKGYGDL